LKGLSRGCGGSTLGLKRSLQTRAGVERVRDALKAAGIDSVQLQGGTADDRSVPGVRVTTMHRAKGLEFFGVAIPFLLRELLSTPGTLKAAVDSADWADILDQRRLESAFWPRTEKCRGLGNGCHVWEHPTTKRVVLTNAAQAGSLRRSWAR
jgi:hypothetical protein